MPLQSKPTIYLSLQQDPFQQFLRAFVGGIAGAESAAESTGEDCFFHRVDLVNDLLGGFPGLLFFFKEFIQSNKYGLLFLNWWNTDNRII